MLSYISVSCRCFPVFKAFLYLQVKRICRDSSFVTLMSLSAKLSLPARFSSHCFGSHGRILIYFCNRLRTARRYVTSLESNHDRSNHNRRIMAENLGVYIALKSAVIEAVFEPSTTTLSSKLIFLCRYTLRELSLFIVFLETAWKLITFSQRSIKLLFGILFKFFYTRKINRNSKAYISLATSHWSLPLCLNTHCL